MNNLRFFGVKRFGLLLLIVFLLGSLQGCKYYYKVKTVKNISAEEIAKYIDENKYIILHQDSLARYLSSPHISGNKLTGELINLPFNHTSYKTTKVNRSNRYYKKNDHVSSSVLSEVHLYMWNSFVKEFGSANYVVIPVSEIAYSDIYSMAKTRSIASWAVPILGPIFIGFTVLIIMLINDPI